MTNKAKFKAMGVTLLAVLVLTACGQKRALYLPEEPTTNSSSQDSKPLTESTEKGED
ncbi:MAG: lipoprotein [Paraglaciecola sp.]|uniref:LPS translocon maturation chaperone LptM n=1 Tax=Paraglaciecola sp. TaxID=1920173 RepID=UPI003298A845